MNELSKILIKLSQEVLALCEQQDIPCILSDETAQTFIRNDYDPDALTSLQLLIRTDDFDKLFHLLDTTCIPSRGVESMKNNDLYPTFSMYYVDTDTSCYLSDSNYYHHNAGIHILPLRKKLGKFQNRLYARLERWQLGIGKALYPKLLSVYKLGDNHRGFLQCTAHKRVNYSVDELFGINRIFVSGISFPVSALVAERSRVSCKLAQILTFHAGNSSVSKTQTKEEKTFFTTLTKTLMRKFRQFAKKRIYPVNKDWTKLQCVNDRLVLKEHYEKKLPLIRELVKNHDTKRLREELLPYHEKLSYYYQTCNITIKFDQEIFDIYQKVYLHKEDKTYIHALIRHIPKTWR